MEKTSSAHTTNILVSSGWRTSYYYSQRPRAINLRTLDRKFVSSALDGKNSIESLVRDWELEVIAPHK
jgi:hypothetical protein